MSIASINIERVGTGEPAAPYSMSDVTAYINAGGRGTRLNTLFTPDPNLGISKALLTINDNEPMTLIDYHISRLQANGVNRIVVGAGDHTPVADHIYNQYGIVGGVDVVLTKDQSGTAGDLYKSVVSRPELFGPNILVQNCDTLLDVDERRLVQFHRESSALLSIVTTQLQGTANSGAFLIGGDGKVLFNAEAQDKNTAKDLTEEQHLRASSCGMLVIDREVLLASGSEFEHSKSYSLYRESMRFCLERSGVFAYDNGTNFFCDIGTPEDYAKVRGMHNILRELLTNVISVHNAA